MLILAFALAGWTPVTAAVTAPVRAAPQICPPQCDTIPGSAWIDPASIPLASVYRWPAPAALSVPVTTPRFEFESWCNTPPRETDPRDIAVAARVEVSNPPGHWNLNMQVVHWRGDTVAGGRDALEALEWARMELLSCHLTAAEVSPTLTTSTAMDLAAVITDGGRRVLRTYLIADPGSSTVVELSLWSTVPPAVEWRAPTPDTAVFDAMAAPLCEAYLGSCR